MRPDHAPARTATSRRRNPARVAERFLRRRVGFALALSALGVLIGRPSHGDAQRLDYPAARKGDVVDDYHGTRIADPYRWMEDLNAPDVAQWVAAENALTKSYMARIPYRDAIKKRITELWNYPKVSLPQREGGKLFFRKNSGLQRQSVLYVRDSLNGPAREVLDPNTLSPDGSISLSGTSPSPDARYLAYSLSEGGADWQQVHVKDLRTGRDLPDTLEWVRFSGISWTHDGQGFFYSRFPARPDSEKLSAALSDMKFYYHRLGTPQSQDRLIYERPDLPAYFINGGVTEDGRWLLVIMSRGSDPSNRLLVADLGDPMHPNVGAPLRALVDRDTASFSPLGTVGNTLYVLTDLAAPNRRIVSTDLSAGGAPQWRTVVPEGKNAIEGVALLPDRFVIEYLVDVKSDVRFVSLDGKPMGTLPLPGVGTLAGMSARQDTPELFYGFTSPLYATVSFRYDLRTGKSTSVDDARPPFDPSQYETKEAFATSKDGTRVPVFITMRKGMKLDGSHPAMLYGYGGFDISTTPTYRTDVPMWLELGGIWVTASMRGGGEYGEAWHHAGMLDKKQNVFDDFIAAAEFLVKEGYTSPSKLAISGGSNGGLLVGAVLEQRPDLFAVALPAVGVMDMLRYDRFTGGRAWVPEYGTSSNPEQFAYLVKYSPLHNIHAGTCYPATFVTTADHDDRVVPSHSFKFTATLQAAQGCDKPVLIRVETEGSHGYRPTDKRIDELADEWAFTAWNMGLQVGATP
ncbi:MAG TPA: prolyl oligopeptidase family serine peptidase [Gemmatimonadaceae bacterium]|nr:prolyl oligopeptidase family serine peptidase [Gemmatimonadaceae bacterium]